MNSYFDVYLGNLSISTSEEHLMQLFSQFGEVSRVWIKDTHRKFTYGFVTFYNLNDAKKACEVFNNQNLDGLILKVNISIKTQERLGGAVRKKTKETSILSEHLPKKEGSEGIKKEKLLRDILQHKIRKYQNDDSNFIQTFKNALTEMKVVAPKVSCPLIRNSSEKADLETLESIVLRYHEPVKKNYLFKAIDFDLSNGKLLKTEENENYFKI